MDYTSPSEEIRRKINSLLQAWGEEVPVEIEEPEASIKPDRERFTVPHASRDPDILQNKDLINENIFDLIQTPPDTGVVQFS